MTSPGRNSRLLRTPILATAILAAAGVASAADFAAAPQKARMNFTLEEILEPLDPATILFGEVMFDYYTSSNFHAVTKLLNARKSGVLSSSDDYAEMLLGDLYTSFGLVDSAEKIFAGLINRDILAKTRNETWFHTAELQYNQGNHEGAARILENKVAGLSADLEKARLVMLGNIYIQRGEFQRAADLLAGVKADDIMGIYALYNAGVALTRAGDLERGLPLLRQVRDMPPGDEETNALKDRSAIAMGFTHLQRNEHDLARESLITVRTDGPFTNQAMLGLGYANFQRNEFKKALPPWLELLQRNTSDTTVQEALLLAPRAYEELGAQPQALLGYRYAADTLRNELKKVERTIIRIRESDWLDSLSPETANDAVVSDPLAPVRAYTPANIPEAPYLYSLFASKEFTEEYKVFLEMRRIELLINYWQKQIPMYQEMLAAHRIKLAALQPQLDALVLHGQAEIPALRSRIEPLEIRMDNAIRADDVEQTANIEQLTRLDTARALREQFGPYATESIRERIRHVEGLARWDIATTAQAQQEQTMKDLAQLKLDVEQAERHVAALTRIKQEVVLRMGTTVDSQLNRAADRLATLRMEIAGRVRQQTIVLQNKALTVLAENRRNLGAQLAETHLSIARLQDVSVSEDLEKRKRQ